jgi:hypothetical protein
MRIILNLLINGGYKMDMIIVFTIKLFQLTAIMSGTVFMVAVLSFVVSGIIKEIRRGTYDRRNY